MAEAKLCAVDGCGKKHYCRGWCATHYQRWKIHGDPSEGVPIRTVHRGRICSIETCGNPAVSSCGLCGAHYKRRVRSGDQMSIAPVAGRKKPAPKGQPQKFLSDAKLIETDDCIIWPFSGNGHGYGQVRIDGKLRPVHRVVCLECHGDPLSPEHEAAHSCGNGHLGCINKRHLSWKTPSDNCADKLIHGTDHRGEKHGMAKLTEDDVREIRSLRGTMKLAEVAERFGIGCSTVCQIQSRKSWAWLP